MSEEATKQVAVDTLPMAEFKKARAEGKTVIEQPAEPVEETKVEGETEQEQKSEEQKTEEQKSKSRGGFQKRIDRLVKHNSKLEEELETLRAAKEKTNGKEPEKAAPAAEGEPQRDKFASDAEYNKAMIKWGVSEVLRERAEADAKRDFEAREAEILKTYNARVAEAKSRYEDWSDVVNQEVDIPIAVGRAILLMPNGPDVAYHVGQNAELREELLGLDPIEAVGRAWEISKELGGKKEEAEENEGDEKAVETEETEEKPVKLTSKAPAPIKPVGGGSTKSTIPLDKMNLKEYKKARAAGRVH